MQASVTPTPLPKAQLAALGWVLLASYAGTFMIYSFLPFMVAHLMPSVPTEQLGFYAGMLGSSFHCGSLIGGTFWGKAADKYGRKPCILFGLYGTVLSAVAFGFSPTYSAAMLSRFMWGLLNGNMGLSKTSAGELLDETNQANGMTVFGIIGGIGRIVGPLLGGTLSEPAKRYRSLRHVAILQQFPFLLPSLCMAVLTVVALVHTYLYLVETLPNPTPLCWSRSALAYSVVNPEDTSPTDAHGEEQVTFSISQGDAMIPLEQASNNALQSPSSTPSLYSLMQQSDVFYSTVCFGLCGFCQVCVVEVFPLWAVVPPPPENGGLGFDSVSIGLALACTGPAQIISFMILYPMLAKRVKELRAFRLCVLVFAVCVSLVPFSSQLALLHMRWLSFGALTVALIFVNTPLLWGNTAVITLINNSCLQKERGTVNGIGQSLSDGGRMLAPMVAGYMFAWSEINGLPWPFNYCFTFHFVSLVALGNFFLARKLPPSIVVRKAERIASVATSPTKTDSDGVLEGLELLPQAALSLEMPVISKYTRVQTFDETEDISLSDTEADMKSVR